MLRNYKLRQDGGFSLIEVLIAVVILSVGLLALAALQINVVRSSADSKSRSTALSLAQEKLEQAREFRSRGSDQVNCPATNAATWPERYSCVAAPAAAETFTVGGTTYSRNWTVDRYVFDENTGSFDVAAVGTADSALAAGLRAGTEFKRVEVTVGWVDAEGENRSITVTDSVSAASPSESSRARAFQRKGVRTPEVLIFDPSGTPGVIPIAIGNGTDTAATNPRPEVAGRNQSQRVVETRFDVLTYAGLNNNTAQVQSRVETVVVGCTCVDAPGAGLSYRPTYWTGTRYAKPEKIAATAAARHKSLGNNDPAESQYCTECCRDHHDAGFSGPKVSPRRASHTHLITGGEYEEACRLIRVDGIFRVASDPYSDYFNLLATSNSADDSIPDPGAASNYQSLVLDYLDDRVVTPSSAYNTPLGAVAIAGLETAHGINDPATINIESASDNKWMHARGLYVDHMEQDAIDAINEAKANCGGDVTACTLPYVPFTSINVTEIANWLPEVGSFHVTNSDFRTALNFQNPVRGQAITANAAAGMVQVATTSMNDTSAGLALLDDPINADDGTVVDTQTFQVTGGGTPPVGTTGDFTVNVSGYPFGISTVAPSFSGAGIAAGCSATNPFACTSTALGGAYNLTIGNYNEARPGSVSRSLTCTKGNSSVVCPLTFNTSICRNYGVLTATVGVVPATGISVANSGLLSETSTMSFTSLNPNNVVNIIMHVESETEAGATCTYTGNDANACLNANIAIGACP